MFMFIVSSFSCFISNSCFMNISIHIAFPIFPCFMPLTYGISYTYTGMLMYSHIIHVFLFLYESTLLRNWNHSNRIIRTKVMAFSCQPSRFIRILPEGQFEILIFECLDYIFDTGYLYSFKSKVIRVLFQLESPKSEHRKSSYVRNNPDYFMIKIEAEFGWIISLL